MLAPEIEVVDLTSVVGDLEVPCEYADETLCPDGPARWILHVIPCANCRLGGVRLACDFCKDARVFAEDAVYCDCGEVVMPARRAYSHFEPLERRR